MCVDEPKFAATCVLWLLGWFLLTPGVIQAEQLPLKTYTTADGLAQDSVTRIVRDSRGFLWFCTAEGLSRFDGYGFTSYTTDQGLPNRWVTDLLETREGAYWVATGGGVCKFNPAGVTLFAVYSPDQNADSQRVEALAQDHEGAIWCGTHNGLYLLEEAARQPSFQFIDIGMPATAEGNLVQVLVVDRQGALWIGTRGSGLYRRWPDGRVEHYTVRNGLPDKRIEAFLQDSSGRFWVGAPEGLAQLVASPDPDHPVVARLYTANDGLTWNWIASLFQSTDGTMWVSNSALSEFTPAPGDTPAARSSQRFRTYTTRNGLSSPNIGAMAEDRDGNLWIGTESGGAMKLARRGFTTYTEADGLAAPGVDAVFEDRAGEICAISSYTRHFINRFDGRRFSAVWPAVPKQINNFGWGYNQVTLQDRRGEWWVPTGQGLCRFPAVNRFEQLATIPPKRVYTRRDGLPTDDIFRLYQDSHGDIWISTGNNGPTRWNRSTETLHTFSEADGFVPPSMASQTAFAEDAAGNLWIGNWNGDLARYSRGRFTFFTEADGLPRGAIRSFYLDHAHRLWIAASLGGLARVDDPGADRPHFNTYTTAEGLSSNDVWCVTEDLFGRIYIGTGRGLDRLDPETGHIKHYTAADGLFRGKVTSAFRDSRGVLWFASNVDGLSRLVPAPDPPQTPPSILIGGLRIAGAAQSLSQLGETEIARLDLGPSQNQLSIDFVGLSFGPGEVLRYQYQLEGADRDWSQPGEQRSVNYAHLAPGSYRFLVRAVNAEGLFSKAPASVAFRIQPPLWRRWWFLTLAAILVGLGIYTAYRARVVRLVELERVRTRIATDLHDDIGANLSLIAMVSEVARSHVPPDHQRLKEWFSTIASTSRDTVDSMSDIVWAVNPRRDQLSDLILRMRGFADDILDARGIQLGFRAPEPGRDLKVGADLRREVFLIFKESINNMVRHSRCTAAQVDLLIDRGWLVLRTKDNGRGFDVVDTPEGNGLASMRQRAKKLGGSLEVSSNGHGTSVILRVPLGSRGRH